MSRRRLVLVLVVAAAFFGWAQAARAATITVNTTADNGPTAGECGTDPVVPGNCSLRQAINAASSGDEIDVPTGTYTLTLPSTASGGGALRLTKNLTIVGQGAGPADVVITASYPTFDDRLMTVSGIDVPPAVVLQKLTLNGGKTSSANDVNSGGGAAIWLASGNLTLSSVVLSQNHAMFGAADADGGAIDDTGGNLTLDNVTASSNVGANGGAIADTGGSLTFNNTTFTGNDAVAGGGIYLDISDQSATGVASTFYANALSVGGGGGGIMVESGGVNLTNSTFMGNGAGTIPGGGIDNHGGTLALTNVTLNSNFTSDLNTDDATTTMHNTIIGSGGCSGIGILQSTGNNIFPSNTCAVSRQPSDLMDGVPGLDTLANNGGPTQTEALLARSDAAGAGASCPSVDQRGVTRTYCDIGAFATPLPIVTDESSSEIFDTSAEIDGSVGPNGGATFYFVQYGTTTAYGSQGPTQALGSTPGLQEVDQSLTGLAPDTLYHFRIVARSDAGESDGADMTFVTGVQYTADVGDVVTAQFNGLGCPSSDELSIDWGDDTDPSGGDVSCHLISDQDHFTATGTHTYADPGTYEITATVGSLQFGAGAVISLAGAPAGPAGPSVSPPTVGGPTVNDVTTTTAAVNATIDPNGAPTFYHVEYGPTAAYGQQTGAFSAGSATTARAVAVTLQGLSPGTTYHVRVVATNPAGTTASSDATFTTTATGPPPPVQGQSLDVAPFSGNVIVNGQPLTAGQQIPFGSIIDARNGTITLISIGPTGQLQSASFTGAIFQVVQAPDGSTELILQGGDFSVCKNTKVRRTAGLEAKPKPKPKTKAKKNSRRTPPTVNTTVVRSLWGNGTGQFTTKGRYAAATVRGTVWHTSDRCDGTSVDVRTGVVAVLDLVTGKTIILTAPATYLAHP